MLSPEKALMRFYLPLRSPEPGAVFRRHHDRLALFKPNERVEDYWRAYWSSHKHNEHISQGSDRGELGEYEQPFTKYLKVAGKVVEAGCGPGQLVRALVARGFDAFGIDYEPSVVSWVRENAPGITVLQGDVRALDLSDASLDGYVSLGVVEHFDEGPEAILREARRVLRPDGRALVSVPFLNAARGTALSHADERVPDGYTFYQYYFDETDFEACAARAGLTVIDCVPQFVDAHWTRDHPILGRYWNSRMHPFRTRPFERRAMARVARIAHLRARHAHMMLFVCAVR